MTYDEFIAQAPRYEPPADFDAWVKEALSNRRIEQSEESVEASSQLDAMCAAWMRSQTVQ